MGAEARLVGAQLLFAVADEERDLVGGERVGIDDVAPSARRAPAERVGDRRRRLPVAERGPLDRHRQTDGEGADPGGETPPGALRFRTAIRPQAT